MATDNVHARKEVKETINIHDGSELRYWSNLFGVTQEDVLNAVRSEGNDPDSVKNYLRGNNNQLKKGK